MSAPPPSSPVDEEPPLPYSLVDEEPPPPYSPGDGPPPYTPDHERSYAAIGRILALGGYSHDTPDAEKRTFLKTVWNNKETFNVTPDDMVFLTAKIMELNTLEAQSRSGTSS